MARWVRALAALLIMTPLGAAAQDFRQCIGEYALEDGIRVTFTDGAVMEFRGFADGLVEIGRVDPSAPGVIQRFTSMHGIYFLDEFQRVDGEVLSEGRVQTVFGEPLSALPTPFDAGSWQGQNLNIIGGRSQPRVETMRVEFGEESAFYRIGRCSYEGIAMAVRYEWPEDGFGQSQQFVYLVNVGIALPVFSRFDDQQPVLFEPTDIQRLR